MAVVGANVQACLSRTRGTPLLVQAFSCSELIANETVRIIIPPDQGGATTPNTRPSADPVGHFFTPFPILRSLRPSSFAVVTGSPQPRRATPPVTASHKQRSIGQASFFFMPLLSMRSRLPACERGQQAWHSDDEGRVSALFLGDHINSACTTADLIPCF
jgi:hypothetical protein